MQPSGEAHSVHSRLRLAVPPRGVFDALVDIGPRHRWFLRHAGSLGAVEPEGEYGLRGGYHFWSHFAPDPPPALTTTLTALALPSELDAAVKMHFLWNHRGRQTEVDLELEPEGGGSTLYLLHHGLRPLAEEPLGGAAYWTVVLENMRLYLLGSDGLLFHHARSQGALELGLNLVTPGLDGTAAAWDVLTTPSELDRLWGRGAFIEPRVGGELSFGWEGGGPGRILDFSAPRRDGGVVSARLSSLWQLSSDALPTVLTWQLRGEGSRTRLTVVHSGFGDAGSGDAYLDTWRAMLGRLSSALDDRQNWES